MSKILQLINKYDLANIEHPHWKKAGRVHEWRNYIPDNLQEIWQHLSLETRIVAYYFAEQIASNEIWD